LWFQTDALVVLRAEDRIFRVSQSILAARSPVFQAMFEFPQPAAEGDEFMDGSHVIRLHDAAADVEPFLRAIFDSSYFMPPPAEAEFHAVLGILRLSHKYDVEYLHKRALLHLETVYPITVSRYFKLNYRESIIALDLKAISVLQEVGATWLLPAAFYIVGTCPTKTILAAGDAWHKLFEDTKQTCLRMEAHNVRATYKMLRFLAPSSHESCLFPETCDSTRRDMSNDSVFCRGGWETDQEPLSEWAMRWGLLRERLCTQCFAEARMEHDATGEEIWEAFPHRCGLEGW
ncbi:hypothetical protein B0H11DRAFT_1675936, partial [Mycena galericulata]